MERRSENLVVAEGKIQGESGLRIGQRHFFLLKTLGDFGKQYSGEYFVTATTHKYTEREGYITTFEAKRSGLTKL